MANISFDYGLTKLKTKTEGVSTYTFRDIGTANIKQFYVKKNETEQQKVRDCNTYNIDENAIKTSLNNLFNFIPGQSILDPEFGHQLYKYYYTPLTYIVQTNLKRDIIALIEKFQPRIQLTEINLTPNSDKLLYNIQLKYYITQLKKSSSLSLNLTSQGQLISN